MLHQIGIGTLGPVFRTYEPSRDRLVAVKVFRLDIVPEQAQALAAALTRAAKASLFHPSIVEPIDAGVEGTLAYRAEEYVAAESLDVAMRHYAPAPVERALTFITQLAGAIDFARAAGIGHGGLHPRDIFVTPDEARATGFGVVDALEQVGIRAPVRRPYSPPERIDGSAWGTSADVFSLAAITFELLTGKRPSGSGNEIGALPDGPQTAALHTVLARAMHDDPARRYNSALAFAAALEAASQGRPVTGVVMAPAPAAVSETPVKPIAPIVPPPEATIVPPVVVSPPAPAVETEVKPPPPLKLEPKPEPTRQPKIEPPPVVRPIERPREEFEIEPTVHSVRQPFQEDPRPVMLFDTDSARESETTEKRFIDDFVSEQSGENTLVAHAPIADVRPRDASEPPAIEPPMFRTVAPELDSHDAADHGRPAILPYAVVSVLMLLVGFAGGYFVGSQDRGVGGIESKAAATAAATPPASAPSSASPSGAATGEQPGQYSEHKVAAAPPPTPPPAASTSAPPTRTAASPAAAVPPAKPAPDPRVPVATRGQIVVRSQPVRAGVTINGTWRGRTPLTLDNLPFGAYTIRVVQPGYQVVRDEFTLNAHAPSRTFTAKLERAQPAPAAPKSAPAASETAVYTGTLYVDSRPRGAAVTIDGKSAGQTPVSLSDVQVGSHVVRIEMDGKKPVNATARIVAGKTERITVSLEDKQEMSASNVPNGHGPRAGADRR